jgi:hypothetical protein
MAESKGLLRVVSPSEVDASERARAALVTEPEGTPDLTELTHFVRREWRRFRDHRQQVGLNKRLLVALQTFNGQYPAAKLHEIRKFGGSEVYSRITAVKCRGATSLLRDVYLGNERPWSIAPTPDPEMPTNSMGAILTLVQSEVETMAQAGQQVPEEIVEQRVQQLIGAAKDAAYKQAKEAAKRAKTRLDDLLVEGRFYETLAQILVDLPIFPFTVMKGPVVRIVPAVKWVQGMPQVRDTPKMFWERVSPFDVYWSPGVSDIRDAAVIERTHMVASDLTDVIGLPGYDEEAVRGALREYGEHGHIEEPDNYDQERADLESKENPTFNRTGTINGLEYHGPVQGSLLMEHGFTPEEVPDPDRTYMVQAWLVGRFLIKIQLSPSPRKRHPYFITSFEKVPGTVIGNGLVDVLADIQDVANACLRALVNNLSIASGPQVVVLDDRFGATADTDSLYPWKRWHMLSDPMGNNTGKPIDFFQPNSHAQELLQVYQQFTVIADEISAIPRYATGSGATGGAGRTASGLSMLMNNASKILQTVADNIDRDLIGPLLEQLYDMVLLTDETGLLRGDESVEVQGVSVAAQRETDRMRQLEFLNATANPIDIDIIGPEGRAELLRSISETLGLRGSRIVPTEQELLARQQQAAMAEQAAQAQGDQSAPGQPDNGPTENLTRTRTAPGAPEQRQRAPEQRI